MPNEINKNNESVKEEGWTDTLRVSSQEGWSHWEVQTTSSYESYCQNPAIVNWNITCLKINDRKPY